MNKIIYLSLIVWLVGSLSVSFAQPLQLVAEPIYPDYQAESVYAPLTEYLSQSIGREVQLVNPSSFRQHWRDTQSRVAYDLVLESAPITDFRIRRQQYIPLVRIDEPTTYSLAVLNPEYTNRNDLLGLPVATLQAPSVSYLMMTRWYDNPLSQPQVKSSAPTWEDAVLQLFGGEVEAAVLPTSFADGYPQITFIQSSDALPPQAISASTNLSEELREQIKAALLALNDDENMDILTVIGIGNLVEANAEEYTGYANWLRVISLSPF